MAVGGQTAALNALKNRWLWWLAAKRCKAPAWRVALERLAKGLEALEGLKGLRGLGGLKRGQTAALNAFKNRWPWCLAGGGGRANGSLNALKNRWPWWLAAKRCKGRAWRVALERLAEGWSFHLCDLPAWRVGRLWHTSSLKLRLNRCWHHRWRSLKRSWYQSSSGMNEHGWSMTLHRLLIGCIVGKDPNPAGPGCKDIACGTI